MQGQGNAMQLYGREANLKYRVILVAHVRRDYVFLGRKSYENAPVAFITVHDARAEAENKWLELNDIVQNEWWDPWNSEWLRNNHGLEGKLFAVKKIDQVAYMSIG